MKSLELHSFLLTHLHNLLANLYFPKLKNEHGTEPFKVVVRLLLHLLILQGLASSGPRSNKSTGSVTAVQVRRPPLRFPPNFGSENFPGFRASHFGLFAHFYGRPCYSRTVSWAAGPALGQKIRTDGQRSTPRYHHAKQKGTEVQRA